MEKPLDEYFKTNKAKWNELTHVHAKSASYDVAGFKAGKNTLLSVEREELGDVSGKRLLHLQCHFGLDTMSWARLGANVTGVDFSEEAISLARSLAAECGVEAQFVCSNIYDLRDALSGKFDIVFTSYGVLAWLSDLDGWARIIAHFLEDGGTFLIAEEHPIGGVFEGESGGLEFAYPYFGSPQPERWEDEYTYTDQEAPISHTAEYEWTHSLSEIINALIGAGLTISNVREYPFCMYRRYPCMEKEEDGWWRLPAKYGDLPMLFSVKATQT